MSAGVTLDERPGSPDFPRILFLPGLGARANGFSLLADRLRSSARCVLVEYPRGSDAGDTPGELAARLAATVGSFQGVVASSYGGLLAGELVRQGHVKNAAFIGSFFRKSHLGWRGPFVPLLGGVAIGVRPGRLFASIASARLVSRETTADIVPTTREEQWALWYRSNALRRWPDPGDLRGIEGKFLVIQGGRDLLVPPRVADRLLKDLPPRTFLFRIPEAGHVPYSTHPAECAERLANWCADL